MGIEVEWRDESGMVLGEVPDSGALLSSALARSSLEKTSCLRYIDAYGDTTFNQLQLSELVAELNELSSFCSGELSVHLRCVADLCEHATGKVHTYVTFVGD